ncbi:DUF6249 domain-containing protein [Tenacibaculum sp. nBUS_03]|uniref:DUF6249 domain-containing protein n=1 Tax=Tenacibaculum sp. nBUS_03 TaxID=3395320 RepID=UPI003EB71856
MKPIKEMTFEELEKYIINKKMIGASFRDINNIFDKNEIDTNTKALIMPKLYEIDKQQKKELNKIEKSNMRQNGIINIFIGIGITIFGFVLYKLSSKVGIIFIFNFIVWGVGGIMILQGLFNLISGSLKANNSNKV